MTEKYFGTDGIRGKANTHPMTAESALHIGMAAGNYFRKNNANQHRVVIGKDTRLSCYMIENALTAGLTATGMNVLLLGPIPTPAVGLLTRSMRADLGVMISASHNPHYDNGIKFFNPEGNKLSVDVENEIERIINNGSTLIKSEWIGRAQRIDGGQGRYVEYAKTTFPKNLRLSDLRIVIDCANGAGYKVAPEVLWELGADLVPIGVNPDGYNINDETGTSDPTAAIKRVAETRADIGICLDGDADRVLIIDEKGVVADGDQILTMLALRMAARGSLLNNTVVTTVMSNLGMEKFLKSNGISLLRTSVGDRFVAEKMLDGPYNLGGEQSGHIIMSDYTTTGDGLISALQFLAVLVETGKKASEIANQFKPVPQVLRNVPSRVGYDPTNDQKVLECIREHKNCLNDSGRVLVRKSGTEPLVRIMVEGVDIIKIGTIADDICTKIQESNF